MHNVLENTVVLWLMQRVWQNLFPWIITELQNKENSLLSRPSWMPWWGEGWDISKDLCTCCGRKVPLAVAGYKGNISCSLLVGTLIAPRLGITHYLTFRKFLLMTDWDIQRSRSPANTSKRRFGPLHVDTPAQGWAGNWAVWLLHTASITGG